MVKKITSRGICAYFRGIHVRFLYGIILKYTEYTGHTDFFYYFCVAFGHWLRFAVPHVNDPYFKCQIRTQEVSLSHGPFERSALH